MTLIVSFEQIEPLFATCQHGMVHMREVLALGVRLTALRKARGVSQEQLAEAIGVSRSTYQFYERDERDMPSSILLKLCEFFDDDAHRILTGAPSSLAVDRIMQISILVDERLEDLDIDITPQAKWRVITKALHDEYRATSPVTHDNDVAQTEIDSLLRMMA